MTPDPNMEDLRSSQRAPMRCTECAQRRVRCDKKIPCGRCIANHRAHTCEREIVRVRGKPTIASTSTELEGASLMQQNSFLRERVSELELALATTIQNKHMVQDRQDDLTAHAHTSPDIPREEIDAILDGWSIGRLRNTDTQDSSTHRDKLNSAEVLNAVPERSLSKKLVEFSVTVFGWVHCALNVNEFLAEHEAFQDSIAAGTLETFQNPGWLAVYFSVLTVGLFFMEGDEGPLLNASILVQDMSHLETCKLWYNLAIKQLEISNAMSEPQLCVVQVAAILGLCHSHFGTRFQGVNLYSLARNAALGLEMHRLGSEKSYPKTLEQSREWSMEAGRELGRRLWWTLVICDWLMEPRMPSCILPESFDTKLSEGNWDYTVLSPLPQVFETGGEASPLLHHIELAKLARVFFDYKRIAKKSHANLRDYLQKLNGLEQNFAARLSSYQRESGHKRTETVWLMAQKAHYLCTLNFMRLSVCRVFLEPDMARITVFSDIRDVGIRAALDIVHISNLPQEYRLLWLFGSATIAAGVFLGLDLLSFFQHRTINQIQEQSSSIESCISLLQHNSHKTAICREGPKILSRLLDFERNQRGKSLRPDEIKEFIITTANSLRELPIQGNSGLDHGEHSFRLLNDTITYQVDPSLPPSSSILPAFYDAFDHTSSFWLWDDLATSTYHM